MESFILFYEKCRLCLDKPGVCNMFEKEEFPQDIYLCTGVKVHPTDNLPQKICDMCAKVIASAKELRVIATKNNAHLRSLFHYDELRLQICENDVASNDSNGKHFNNIEKRDSSPDGENIEYSVKKSSPRNKKPVAVRKDLFDNSATVSSSTINQSDATEPRSKKLKLEDSSFLYECTTCQKMFDTPKKLYLHSRMHNKSIVCPLDACSKRFATKGDLEKHFRTHTGEKPYSCHICSRGFAQRSTLKSHRQTQHAKR